MEGEAQVPLEPLADLKVLAGCVVKQHMDRLAGGHPCLDQISNLDEFLVGCRCMLPLITVPSSMIGAAKSVVVPPPLAA
jgi:hypothetical protein